MDTMDKMGGLKRRAESMRWGLIILVTAALVGCAHSVKEADSIPREPARAGDLPGTEGVVEFKLRDARLVEIESAIIAYWVRQNQDRKVFRYIDPELCAWPVVAKLRREAFVIYPKTDARPPRNSWDTDESRTWYDLDLGEIKIDGDEATARVTTGWGAGFHVQEYSLRWDSGRWFVARAETLIVT